MKKSTQHNNLGMLFAFLALTLVSANAQATIIEYEIAWTANSSLLSGGKTLSGAGSYSYNTELMDALIAGRYNEPGVSFTSFLNGLTLSGIEGFNPFTFNDDLIDDSTLDTLALWDSKEIDIKSFDPTGMSFYGILNGENNATHVVQGRIFDAVQTVAQVPEPYTLSLMGLGIGFLIWQNKKPNFNPVTLRA